MKKTPLWIVPIIMLMLVSLACSLGSITGSGGSAPTAGGNSSGADMNAYTAGPEFPLVRKDSTTFSQDKFVARSLPVEVIFEGNETAEVVLAGALAQPTFNGASPATESIDVLLVLQREVSEVLYMHGNDIVADKWVISAVVDLLDGSGKVLSSKEFNRSASLYPNFPQLFRFYNGTIPGSPASVRIKLSLEKGYLYLSCASPSPTTFCATTDDLGFQVPAPIAYHSPVSITIKLGDWNEAQPKKSVLGEFTFKTKNLFNLQMDIHTTSLFLNAAGDLVGWMEMDEVLAPNEIYDRNAYGDFYQSTYFSEIPTRVLIYDYAKFSDLIKAVR